MFQDQSKKNKDQPIEDKPHNDKKKSKETGNEQKQSAGPGGPGDPNWPPKKNGNNKKPDKNNDDKKNEKREDKDNSEKKDNEQKKNEPQQQKIQNQLNSQEISKHIIENKKIIFEVIEPALKELTKNGNMIKNIRIDAFKIDHIFSKKHLSGALSKIEKSVTQTSEKIIKEAINYSLKIIEVVSKADKGNNLKELGTTPLKTIINGLVIEIHVHIKNGILFSFDAFVDLSGKRPGIFISLD